MPSFRYYEIIIKLFIKFLFRGYEIVGESRVPSYNNSEECLMNREEKNKLIKHIVIVILLCIPMTFLWYAIINSNNPTSYKTETVTATEPRVYVTTYGERYHSAGCSYLSKSQIPMGKQEAISKGYSACSRCGGRASGTIDVKYTKQVEVDGTSKNIWGAIGLSALCTPLAYLFIICLVGGAIENRRYKNASSSTIPKPIPSTSTANPSNITPPPAPKPTLPSIRVGDAVNHKKFGLGVVKKIDGKYFTVQFDHESKDFIHPDVFLSGIMENFNAKNRDKL